jgi:hypothetical protein
MTTSTTGGASWRVIAIQIGILLGLAVFFKFYLPHRAHNMARQALVAREHGITTLFQNSVVEDSGPEISVPLDGAVVKRHPQKLRTLFSPDDAESTLGVPDSTMTDFQGGQHLTWTGTTHKLEAAFNAGRLYCLTFEERATGHGVQVFESPQSWHPY